MVITARPITMEILAFFFDSEHFKIAEQNSEFSKKHCWVVKNGRQYEILAHY